MMRNKICNNIPRYKPILHWGNSLNPLLLALALETHQLFRFVKPLLREVHISEKKYQSERKKALKNPKVLLPDMLAYTKQSNVGNKCIVFIKIWITLFMQRNVEFFDPHECAIEGRATGKFSLIRLITIANNDIPYLILKSALEFAPQHGWTIDAISKGAKSLGYSSVTHGMFPRGGLELLDFFLLESRRKMTLEIADKMEGLIGLHYSAEFDKTFYLSALAIMAQPNNLKMSFEHLAKLSDEIWFLAGDKSANMSWYTKRGELALIYSATELYMTQDKSPDFQETWAFLDRRLQEIAVLGKTIHEINKFSSFFKRSIAGALESKRIKFF
ncbi:hypothetical protein G9A89_001025 [Geosiphon pyriformis]|nr:hypothetical protein G9A89_001025 [Geosiphon pyriformis]